MALMIRRFKPVEIISEITFLGKGKKSLSYPVKSIILVPIPKTFLIECPKMPILQIFWQ